jgi:hypothetical protein
MKMHSDEVTNDWVDLLSIPTPICPKPGALDVGLPLRVLLSEQLRNSRLSRGQVAYRMSELLGHEVSKHQLDAWTAESREGWRFPLEYLPALEVALGTHDVCEWLAELRGARLSVGREVLETQLGKLANMKTELKRQELVVKKLLGSSK